MNPDPDARIEQAYCDGMCFPRRLLTDIATPKAYSEARSSAPPPPW